jgi:CBS domain-containing protein
MELKELMTKNVITVLQSMNVRDAAEMLFNMGISGLPVVNDQKNLVGMITEKDIIGMALPKYVEKLGSLAYTFDMVPFAKTLAEADKVLVKEIMRKDVITATVDTSVPEVARIMIVKRIRRIPILDQEGRLVGIIARHDIVKEIFKEADAL